jgi:hypothetical protein
MNSEKIENPSQAMGVVVQSSPDLVFLLKKKVIALLWTT